MRSLSVTFTMVNIQIYKSCYVHFCTSSHRFKDIDMILTFKKFIKITEYNFSSDTIQWQISKDAHTFLLYLLPIRRYTISKYFTFKKYVKIMEYNFRNDAIWWQIKIYKYLPKIFALALTISDINILNCLSSKSRSRSRSAIFAITSFNGKCQNQQMSLTHFCASSYHFRYINFDL